MDSYMLIRGGRRLQGNVWVSGSKNASVALLPASLLSRGFCTLRNIPDNEDTHVCLQTMRSLGAVIRVDGNDIFIDARNINAYEVSTELAQKMRASYYFVPVLLGLLNKAKVPLPGGCAIGARPIDQSLKGLRSLGAVVETGTGIIDAEFSPDNAQGLIEVYLDMPSVGATINTVLMAVSTPANIVIHNAAKEPHVVDVANFLASMGASVKGAGTDEIRIKGGSPLHGSDYTVIPDQIETGTLMIAAAATRGDVHIMGAIPFHMEALTAKLLEMGVTVTCEDDDIHVTADEKDVLRPIRVTTQAYPGFPTDLQQPIAVLMSECSGESTIVENIFESRFRYAEELIRMGARIEVVDSRRAYIKAPFNLSGTRIFAPDLRAGAAMVVAGLVASGETKIGGLEYLLRGYEHLDEKLNSLGADVTIVHEKL